MILQKHFLRVTKQYLSRCNLLKTKNKQTYSKFYCRYSSDATSRKYTDRHEWVTVDKEVGTVGISSYAQESLGDVVFAQLPEPKTNLKAGDECGALESVKAVSELSSPVSGVVIEKNENVESKPALINTSCYKEGWLFKLKLTKPEELEELMTEEQYKKFLKTDVEKNT